LILRAEGRATPQALAIGALIAILAPAVRVERGRAIGADDAEVLETVVVADPIDVVEDQRHPAATPQLVLTAELTYGPLQVRRVQPVLQVVAAVR